jgi:hypothetical protein
LGRWAKKQRKKKRMQYLYVLGEVPVGFGPVIEDDMKENDGWNRKSSGSSWGWLAKCFG